MAHLNLSQPEHSPRATPYTSKQSQASMLTFCLLTKPSIWTFVPHVEHPVRFHVILVFLIVLNQYTVAYHMAVCSLMH